MERNNLQYCLQGRIRVKKILLINTIGFDFEGISSVILNYITNMDSKGLEFSFLSFQTDKLEIKKVLAKQGKVVIVPNRKKVLSYAVALYHELSKSYDVVHINGNSGTMFLETYICSLKKVKKIIIHGHSSSCRHKVLNKILKHVMFKQADVFLTCSKIAGDWLYNGQAYKVLNNAIECERFQYNQEIRNKIREQLGIYNEIVIGHIGNFTAQKNHKFLIEVFSCFHKICPNSKLLLGSDGPLEDEIKQWAKDKNIQDKLIFTGRIKEVELLYQAMDCFVFPSIYEGLGLVAIEAQAASLPVFASEKIPAEANCTPLFFRINLDKGAKYWAEEMNKVLQTKMDRTTNYIELIKEKGFDIAKESSKLKNIYIGELP